MLRVPHKCPPGRMVIPCVSRAEDYFRHRDGLAAAVAMKRTAWRAQAGVGSGIGNGHSPLGSAVIASIAARQIASANES